MSEKPMYTCKKCGKTKPLEGFYTNSKIDINRPYDLTCRICYQAIRKARGRNTGTIQSRAKRRTRNTLNNNHHQNNPSQLPCTTRQFHIFIGPKIRNDIQILTKREKAKLNSVCQGHGDRAELEAAHVGKTRVQIIDSVLTKYVIDEEKHIIQVDLGKVIDEIIEAHMPLSGHFKFLCANCHRKFDAVKVE